MDTTPVCERLISRGFYFTRVLIPDVGLYADVFSKLIGDFSWEGALDFQWQPGMTDVLLVSVNLL